MDRIDALLETFLAGTATPAEASELQSILGSSAHARRRLVEQSTLDGFLADLYKQAAPAPRARRRVTARATASAWPWVVALAAATLFAIVLAIARTPRPAPSPVAQRDTPPLPPPRVPDLPAPSPVPPAPEPPEERTPGEPAPPIPDAPRQTPPPAPAAPPPPAPPAPPAPPTEPAIARVTDADGTRDLTAGATAEKPGVIEFPDGTRVTLADATAISELAPAGLRVTKGTIDADVAKRPKDSPFTFRTAHAEAIIVGTTIRLSVTPDATQLEVTRGEARLARDGKHVAVKAGTFAVATAKSLSAAQPIPKEETLLSLDFDDEKPAIVQTGDVEKGPNGRSCLAGVGDGGVSKVYIAHPGQGFFAVRGGETLSFDYWVEAKAHKVNFNVLNRTQGRTFEIVVPNLVRGRWTRASIRLSDYAELKEGDWIVNLYMQGVSDSPLRFFVDNLQFTRPRKENR